MAVAEEMPPPEFNADLHVAYLYSAIRGLPRDYSGQEVNSLTLAYYAVAGLAGLRALHMIDKDQVTKWVLSLQVHPTSADYVDDGQFYGFCGSTSTHFLAEEMKDPCHNGSHLASTYCGLAILKIVGYNLLDIDSKALVASMKNLQQANGCFMPIHIGAETDLRFLYCAAAICSMLNDWSGIDKERARDYISKCQSYDGGFGLVPGSESHGGAAYCAVASLRLMNYIQADIVSSLHSCTFIDIPLLLEWTLQRQGTDGGFQGRRNKPSDTCYCFWIGAVLQMLGAYNLIDNLAFEDFLLRNQSWCGGFKKFRHDRYPDLLHSYFGCAALSLLNGEAFLPVNVELGFLSGTES